MGRDDAGVGVQWASWGAGQLVGWPEKALRAPSLTLPRAAGRGFWTYPLSPIAHRLLKRILLQPARGEEVVQGGPNSQDRHAAQ